MQGHMAASPRKPPPLQLLMATPPKMKGQAQPYPQTPLLKGKDALSHATSSMGTCMFAASRVVLGIVCFTSPSKAADTFGLGVASGWVQAMGVRDITFGVATLMLHLSHRPALRVWLPLCMCIPLGDAYVVATFGEGNGVRSGQFCMHIAAAFLVLILAICVHMDPLIMPRMVLGRPISAHDNV
jgi:hypothetical protein